VTICGLPVDKCQRVFVCLEDVDLYKFKCVIHRDLVLH
jgi:hypothetical protein